MYDLEVCSHNVMDYFQMPYLVQHKYKIKYCINNTIECGQACVNILGACIY